MSLTRSGRSAAVAWYDPLLRPGSAAFLTTRLGPLAWCKVDDVPPPEPEPPDPDPPPASHPKPPSPPAADDEPPLGHPAWDQPPVEDVDGWELAGWDGAEPVLDTPWPIPRSAPVLVCDVPWLHPEVPAYPDPSGGTALLCPFCGQQHHHGGFGHRLAHCADPRGRGYVLVEVEAVPPWLAHRAPVAELRR